MLDIIAVEQIEAWLRRARDDGRNFDYVQGFLTGLACAPPEYEDFDAELRRAAVSDEDRRSLADKGLDVEALDEALEELYWDIAGGLADGGYRPHMGRYLRLLKPDTPFRQWCEGFLRTHPIFQGLAEEDEAVKMSFVAPLILAGAYDDLPPDELAEAHEAARARLTADLVSLFAHLHEEEYEEEGEEPEDAS